jgi:hypothetical protein
MGKDMTSPPNVARPKRTRLAVPVIAIVVIAVTVLLLGKGPAMHTEEQVRLTSVGDVSAAQWDRLAAVRIFFGHQSVGTNILDGIQDVTKTVPKIRLRVVETTQPEALAEPGLAHCGIGRNRDALSKIDAFVRLMDGGMGSRVDVAFFKLCYIDFGVGTDVEAVFRGYQNAMAGLRARHPKVLVVHLTVPVTSLESGVRAWAKRALGRPVNGQDDNIQRNRFNEMLRREYEGKEPLFDLAKLEATAPDGRRTILEKDGEAFYALLETHTDDGGHLNGSGRRMIAEQLLAFLARLLK